MLSCESQRGCRLLAIFASRRRGDLDNLVRAGSGQKDRQDRRGQSGYERSPELPAARRPPSEPSGDGLEESGEAGDDEYHLAHVVTAYSCYRHLDGHDPWARLLRARGRGPFRRILPRGRTDRYVPVHPSTGRGDPCTHTTWSRRTWSTGERPHRDKHEEYARSAEARAGRQQY